MNRFFFHLSRKQAFFSDTNGLNCADPAAAHHHAMLLARKLIALAGDKDWQGWSIKVTDEENRAVLSILFPQASKGSSGRDEKILPDLSREAT